MRVMTATSSTTSAGSSTKTESGRSGSAGSEITGAPNSARQRFVGLMLRLGLGQVDLLPLR